MVLAGLQRVEEAVARAAPARPAAAPVAVDRVPLLLGATADLVVAAAARLVGPMADALARADVPAALIAECGSLRGQLEGDPDAAAQLVRSAIDGGAAGVGAFLAWKAIAQVLPPLELAAWKSNCCPACGALPGMAQLRATDRGRERALVCGRCATRWPWRRIGCPYCENDGLEQLGVLEAEGEPGFRIDLCRRCNAYLKTWIGDGADGEALSDWSTLHLDAACSARGLRRLGPSLYDL